MSFILVIILKLATVVGIWNKISCSNKFILSGSDLNYSVDGWLRMGLLPPPPREFCRHILSCRELKAESFKRCLHSVLRGVSL